MKLKSLVLGACAALMIAGHAAPVHAEGFAGLLTGKKRLAPITLASGKPLAEKPYELKSGKYYSIDLVSDGSAELAIEGPDFFRNVWVNEIVINDIEIRPMGVSSLEFDDDGKATISFVTIRPGTFTLKIPGTSADSQKAVFVVK
ncbi:MAG: hypothetical protein GY948_06335 [Alphaproteobacteria bacterium]|nr:hypothetical protein [Alphaproteobacteria bacterium]